MALNNIALQMNNISKNFGGIQALKDVSLEVKKGEVHILCGENGAGKSTLMKILSGVYQPSFGQIIIDNEEVKLDNPSIGEEKGVATIYQELSLSPTISIVENMFLGNEITKFSGILDKKAMYNKSKEILHRLNVDINPNTLTGLITIANQQLVQIGKALLLEPKILIMDEPFSSLSDSDSKNLFIIMNELRKTGVSIIYIDHRIENFFKIGDRVTVFRDGEKIGVKEISDCDKDSIISMMVGRDMNDLFPKSNIVQEEIVLEAKNLCSSKIKDISFSVKKGEIFGIGGLVGAGRSEILRAIFGVDKKTGGQLFLDGENINISSPSDAILKGFAYVPENRKLEGLFLDKSIVFNSTIVNIDKMKSGLFVNEKKEKDEVDKMVNILKIKAPNILNSVSSLSGGNQQKVVISKWLQLDGVKILLLDEPTRGIDVGAKYEIYKTISELANKGITIVMVTSELNELIGLCDKIAVIRNGEISGIIEREDFDEKKIMSLCV